MTDSATDSTTDRATLEAQAQALPITRRPLAFRSKADRLAYWRHMFATRAAWAIKALVLIYSHQTEDEQHAEVTTEENGIGFAGTDAEILSSFAKQVERWETHKRFPSPLSEKQLALLHKRMPKYARQVIDSIGDDKAGRILRSQAERDEWLRQHQDRESAPVC